MAANGGGAIALKVGGEVIKRLAPGVLARIGAWARGKEILVLGPRRAGKSSFVEFLQHGILEDEDPDKPRTYNIERTPTFVVRPQAQTEICSC